MFRRIGNFFKRRWAWILSIGFIWIIPLLLLSETVVLAKVSTGVKLTFIGTIAVAVVLLVCRKSIKKYVNTRANTSVKSIYSFANKVAFYVVILFILKGIFVLGSSLMQWWVYSGISFGVGTVMQEINRYKEEKENGEEN